MYCVKARLAIAQLITPLPDGVGPDLRAGGQGADSYLSLKDLRADARLAEREALKSADADIDPLRAGLKAWTDVASRAEQLLSTTSKDLQVAAWLCEAWLRTDGFPGLADGISLLAGLVESWWDGGLHPGEDEDGEETRLAPLFGLFGRGEAGTLLQAIKLLPLTDYGAEPVALWTIEAARALSARHDDPDIREQMAERRRERLDGIGTAIARASPAFAAVTIDALEAALAELDRLMTAIDERTAIGRFGSQIARPLEDSLALLREHHPETVEPEDHPMSDGEGESVEGEVDAAEGRSGEMPKSSSARDRPGEIFDRESALATLIEVAAFFDRNEPQSLVGQSLRDVVRRANLSLDELLSELIPENEQRAMFLLRAGISGVKRDDYSSS
jgi:type VI secretion system protein ImpA